MPTRRLPTLLLPLLLALGVTAIVSIVAATPAAADARSDARTHYNAGKKAYDAGEYEKAIAEFQAADQLAPSGVNDFNIATAYDALGNKVDAIRYFKSYLTRTPEAQNRATVEATISRLERAIADEESARIAAEEEARRQAAEEARKQAAEEARRKQLENQQGGGDGDGDGEVAEPPGQSTGDPELDRVAAIDIDKVRDSQAPVAGVAAAGGGGGGTAGGGGAAPPPVQPVQEPKKSKPIYKQWWFWVVAGVSAYVLISILAADSDSSAQPGAARLQMPTPAPAAGGGYTLWTF